MLVNCIRFEGFDPVLLTFYEDDDDLGDDFDDFEDEDYDDLDYDNLGEGDSFDDNGDFDDLEEDEDDS
jgi:hypothetical protein